MHSSGLFVWLHSNPAVMVHQDIPSGLIKVVFTRSVGLILRLVPQTEAYMSRYWVSHLQMDPETPGTLNHIMWSFLLFFCTDSQLK